MHLRRILAAIALLCAIASPCHAQKTKAQLDLEITNSYPDNHAGAITPQVLRNVSSDVVNSIMPTAPVVSGNNACFDGTTGLLKDCGQAPTSITLNQGSGISLTGTCSGSSVNCTIAVNAGTQVVFPSRAIAKTLNLSGLSAVTTQGYATPGDGGGATFQNIGSAQFLDVSIQSGSITSAGSGCTTGTYFGVPLTGGTGDNLAMATVVAAGGVVTTVTITDPGAGYSVGNVLTGSITGCTFTWTVSAITAPVGSFSDSVGTHFQIVYPAAGIDARALGVKFDWTQSGGDAAATDNFNNLQYGAYYAAALLGGSSLDVGAGQGGKILFPRGQSAMYCGSNGASPLIIPTGVTFQGHGAYVSGIKPCDAWAVSQNYLELCNPNSHLACFSASFRDMFLYSKFNHDLGSSSATSLSAIHSNNCQQEGCGIYDAVVYPGACRRGITFEIGYGGAALIHAIDDVEVKGGYESPQCGGAGAGGGVDILSFGTTQITVDKLTIGGLSPSLGPRDIGMVVTGGFVDINQFYTENVISPLTVSISGGLANGMVRLHGTDAGASCGWLVALTSSNTAGNFLIGGPMATNGCSSGIVQNGQSGGTNMTTPQIADKTFSP